MKRLLALFLLLSCFSHSYSQESDTLTLEENWQKHSPAKATIMSAVVPGLGQAYNKKYWKVPLAWAVIATPLYFGLDQQSKFQEFKDAYAARVDDDPNTVDSKYENVYSNENVLSLIDFHRSNRDLFFVLTAVGYALNVLDAAVDAHLFYFDVGDELGAHFRPSFQYSNRHQAFVPSLTLSLKFAKKTHPHAY